MNKTHTNSNEIKPVRQERTKIIQLVSLFSANLWPVVAAAFDGWYLKVRIMEKRKLFLLFIVNLSQIFDFSNAADECVNIGCVHASAQLIKRINTSIDP